MSNHPETGPARPAGKVLNLVGQMLCRVSEGGGLYHEFRRGIPLGCPISA